MTNVNAAELVAVRESVVNDIEIAQGHIVSLEADLAFNKIQLADTAYLAERRDVIVASIETQKAIIFNKQATISKIDKMIADLNKEVTVEAEVVFESVEAVSVAKESKSTVEVIADQLFEQGYYSTQHDDNSITVTGLQYDLSLTVLEKGYELETYCTSSIEHFNTYEWANHRVVKTLKGLNGYLRRFGFGEVTL